MSKESCGFRECHEKALSWGSGVCASDCSRNSRGQCGQSRGNIRKEAKDATGAPSAWVSQAMMA